MAFPDIVVNVTSPVIIVDCVIRGRISEYRETQPFGLAVSRVLFTASVLIHSVVIMCYAAVSFSYCGASRCLGVVGNDVIPLLLFCLTFGVWRCI